MTSIILVCAGFIFLIKIITSVYSFQYDRDSISGFLKFLIWITALFGSTSLFLISGGIFLPGLYPARPEMLTVSIVGAAIFPFIIILSKEKGVYVFLLIYTFIFMAILSAYPLNLLTLARLLGLSLGLFFFFKAFSDALRKNPNYLDKRIWTKAITAVILIPLALNVGYYQQGRLHSGTFSMEGEERKFSLAQAKFFVKNFPWARGVERAKEVLSIYDPDLLVDADGIPINGDEFYQRVSKFPDKIIMNTAFQNYREICASKLDNAQVLENLTPFLEKWLQELQKDSELSPLPEDLTYRNLLLPLEKITDHPVLEKEFPNFVNRALQRLRKEKDEIASVAKINFKKGNESYKKNNFLSAFNFYQESLSLSKKYSDTRNNLGLTEWKLGNNLLARLHFSILSKLNPNYHGAILNQACVEYSMGLKETAVKRLFGLIQSKKKYASAYYDLGWIRDEDNDLNSAITNFRRATSYKADYTNAWLCLVLVYIQQQEFKRALNVLEEAKKYLKGEDLKKIGAYKKKLEKVIEDQKSEKKEKQTND
jgi:hypothetical protein